MATKIKFYYLDKRVKGEAIRLALLVASIPFEDVRLSYDAVASMRESGFLPFSHVPALTIGDNPQVHTQSQALLRWAGRLGGLYPEEHQLRIDCVTEIVDDLYTEIIKVGYGAAMCRDPHTGRPMVPLTPSQRTQVALSNGGILFPGRFAQLERMLSAATNATMLSGDSSITAVASPALDGPYFTGRQLTIADISFYVLASAILDGAWEGNGVGADALDGCERLLGIVQLVGAHPKVSAWNAAHPAKWFG